jgi:hypothetical protein
MMLSCFPVAASLKLAATVGQAAGGAKGHSGSNRQRRQLSSSQTLWQTTFQI